MGDISGWQYPVPLGIAYILLAGCMLRALFVWVQLPASVGVMLSGFIFRHFFQNELLFARDELQELAFFLVLLTAGLEIRIEHLKLHIFVMAIVPAAFEIVGIALYACCVLHWSRIEGLVLGTVLAALGDGLVIPKMQEFNYSFEGHALPRMVCTWAPVEASFVLTAFGILAGLSTDSTGASIHGIVLSNVLRIVATVAVGILFGATCAGCMNLIKQGSSVFTGSTSEKLLMLLSTTFCAFALGQGEEGKELVPMGFARGSMFQSELLVIVTGACFAKVSDHDILHSVEAALREVWTFGQIFLFSMLGSKITPGLLPELRTLFPVMLFGLLFRLVGVALGLFVTRQSRGRPDTMLPDTLFCFLCTLPRATIQGALGAKPNKLHFFTSAKVPVSVVSAYILTAAQLYILCYSVTGMILLHTLGPRLLKWSTDRDPQSTLLLAENEGERPGLLDDEALVTLKSVKPSDEEHWRVTSDAAGSISPLRRQGTIHGFESYQPRLLAMKGKQETQDAVMLDESSKPGDEAVVVKALRPEKVKLKAYEVVQAAETQDGIIYVEPPAHTWLSDLTGPTEQEINFGPEPDYMLQVPWAPNERSFDFPDGDAVLHVVVPARETRMHLVPRALMLEIPDTIVPGAAVFFQHPDQESYPSWFMTSLPESWSAQKRYLPVRFPKGEYYEDIVGDFFHDVTEKMTEKVSLLMTGDNM